MHPGHYILTQSSPIPLYSFILNLHTIGQRVFPWVGPIPTGLWLKGFPMWLVMHGAVVHWEDW